MLLLGKSDLKPRYPKDRILTTTIEFLVSKILERALQIINMNTVWSISSSRNTTPVYLTQKVQHVSVVEAMSLTKRRSACALGGGLCAGAGGEGTLPIRTLGLLRGVPRTIVWPSNSLSYILWGDLELNPSSTLWVLGGSPDSSTDFYGVIWRCHKQCLLDPAHNLSACVRICRYSVLEPGGRLTAASRHPCRVHDVLDRTDGEPNER